jgi:hypothetical protein
VVMVMEKAWPPSYALRDNRIPFRFCRFFNLMCGFSRAGINPAPTFSFPRKRGCRRGGDFGELSRAVYPRPPSPPRSPSARNGLFKVRPFIRPGSNKGPTRCYFNRSQKFMSKFLMKIAPAQVIARPARGGSKQSPG